MLNHFRNNRNTTYPAGKRMHLFLMLSQTHTQFNIHFVKKDPNFLKLIVNFENTLTFYLVILKGPHHKQGCPIGAFWPWLASRTESRTQHCPGVSLPPPPPRENSRARALPQEEWPLGFKGVACPLPQWTRSGVHDGWLGTFSYSLTRYRTQHQRLGLAIVKQTNRARTSLIEMWGCFQLQVNRLILFPWENLKIISEASMVLALKVLSF